MFSFRIRSSLQTIKAIISSNCNAILVSHMGRPKLVQKKLDDESTLLERRKLSLFPVSERLSQLLQIETMFTEDCVGPQVEIAVNALPKEGGKILLLENLRFYKEEEKNEENFAKYVLNLSFFPCCYERFSLSRFVTKKFRHSTKYCIIPSLIFF